MKGGSTHLTLLEEIPIPTVTEEQKLRYALLCVMEISKDEAFLNWGANWLSGKDRSHKTANSLSKTLERNGKRQEAEIAYALSLMGPSRELLTSTFLAADMAAAAHRRSMRELAKPLDLLSLAKRAME